MYCNSLQVYLYSAQVLYMVIDSIEQVLRDWQDALVMVH